MNNVGKSRSVFKLVILLLVMLVLIQSVLYLINVFNTLKNIKIENEELKQLSNLQRKEINGHKFSDDHHRQLLYKLLTTYFMNNNRFIFTTEKHQSDNPNVTVEDYRPNLEVEKLYRRTYKGVKELWYFVSDELLKLKARLKDNDGKNKIDEILEDGSDFKRTIYTHFYNLSRANGRNKWVRKELNQLEEIVERRIIALQNPTDCNATKKIVCNLYHGCGFACELHHAAYCFLVAFGTRRTLILNSTQLLYGKDAWENVFQPVSDTCVSDQGANRSSWPPIGDPQVIELPYYDRMDPQPDFLPFAIPKDLHDRLLTVHDDPSLWWIGVFEKYLMRPRQLLTDYIQELMDKRNFQNPIVGIHVRRTDKIEEAAYHDFDEYMKPVKDYYAYLQLQNNNVSVKRVYLATDEPAVFKEAIKKYPDYEFLGDSQVVESATLKNRYSLQSLKWIVEDVYLLAHTDYLVCTFSSNFCRLVHELRQTLNADASFNVRSLDASHRFNGQQQRKRKALYDHAPRPNSGHMELKKGDIIHVGGDYFNGFSHGFNTRDNKSGVYPSYKTEDIIPVFEN